MNQDDKTDQEISNDDGEDMGENPPYRPTSNKTIWIFNRRSFI